MNIIGELNRSGVQSRVNNSMPQQGVKPIISSPPKQYQGLGVPSPFLPAPPTLMGASPTNPTGASPANLMRSSPANLMRSSPANLMHSTPMGAMRTPPSYSPGYPQSHVDPATNESVEVAWEKMVLFITSLNSSFNIFNLINDRRS